MTANKLIFVEALFSLKIFLLLLYFPENVFKMPSYMTVSISFFFFFLIAREGKTQSVDSLGSCGEPI